MLEKSDTQVVGQLGEVVTYPSSSIRKKKKLPKEGQEGH